MLVTGAAGFLGWHLLRHLERQNIEAFGTYHRARPDHLSSRCEVLDLSGERDCHQLLASLSPTHVVHTAALSLTSECERAPEMAARVNAGGARHLAQACAAMSNPPYLLALSTDLVFDGSRGSYRETDLPAPLQVYGKTKLQGETEVQAYTGNWAVLRSALIYGPRTPHKACFLQWMVQSIRDGNGALFDDEYRNPVWVEDLSTVIVDLCRRRLQGIYHCGGGGRYSRWEFGKVLAEVYGLKIDTSLRSTRAAHGMESSRPRDVTLNIEKLRNELGYSPTPLRDSLRAVKTWGNLAPAD